MKHIATVALMLNLGVAGVYAHDKPVNPVKMTFSGTGGAGAINLQQPGTANVEESEAGNGSLGRFTLRVISAETTSPQASSTCSGPTHLYSLRVAGAGVFRFEDGSLLKVNVTEGDDCVDFAAQQGHCTLTFQITGGTGRFKNASGTLTLTETVLPVLADAFSIPVFFADTGELTGTVSGVAREDDRDDERH
jgi:hypothetical protein